MSIQIATPYPKSGDLYVVPPIAIVKQTILGIGGF